MKMKSKADLREVHMEEAFRQTQVRVLNLRAHPNVVRMHEVLEDEKFFYVVMENVEGGALFDCLANDYQDGRVPQAAVREVMRDILCAVSHVHRHGMLHRDIKPDNIAMQAWPAEYLAGVGPSRRGRKWLPSKRAVLIDFDHADPAWNGCRSPGGHNDEIFGTLHFNAPEAFRGISTVQSDLFSVGAVLYLLVTGTFPFHDEVYQGVANWTGQGERNLIYQRLQAATVDFPPGRKEPH